MNKELAERVIKGDCTLIEVPRFALDYEIRGKPLSYIDADTLEKREEWYKTTCPKHPDGLSYYLARASLNDPITDEEIKFKQKKDKHNLEAEQRRLEKQKKIKEKRKKRKDAKNGVTTITNGNHIISLK